MRSPHNRLWLPEVEARRAQEEADAAALPPKEPANAKLAALGLDRRGNRCSF
jgi:hypothetical protein